MPGNIINLTPAQIAQWPKANYVDPVERTWLPGYSGTLYGVSTSMVVLRMGLRLNRQAGGLGLDDVLLVGAWFASTMFTAVEIMAGTKYDLGRHAWDIPLGDFEYLAEFTWLAEFSFLLTGGCTKVSVLLFYRRLVAGTYDVRWNWAVLAAITFTAAYTLAFMLALIFNCNPTQAYWKAFDLSWIEHHKYTCADTTAINVLAGICAAASDLYSVILPLIMTKQVGLPRPQRIALNALFSLGLLVVGASAVRTYYLFEVGRQSDVSWYIFDVFVWSQLELQLGIMCASAPALRVFFRRYLSGAVSRAVNSSRSRPSRLGYRLEEEPGVDGQTSVQRVEDWTTKRLSKEEGTFVAQSEMGSQSSISTFNHVNQIRTPEDYEAYNLQNMEKYRETATGRPSRDIHMYGGLSQSTPREWDATADYGRT